MASQFCVQCGHPVPPEAQFCPSCGAPISSKGPSAGAPPQAFSLPTPPPGPSLSDVLPLRGRRSFLLQHQFFSNGHSYRVLSPEKEHLFTVRENLGEEMRMNFPLGLLSGAGPNAGTGMWMGRTFAWRIEDAAKNVRGAVEFQMRGYHAVSTVTDGNGGPSLVVDVDRSFLGKLSATALLPNGQPLYRTQGNLIHHNFLITDPSGREVAKIHEAWASVRDTYNLDLTEAVDPFPALIFAIVLDREKERQ